MFPFRPLARAIPPTFRSRPHIRLFAPDKTDGSDISSPCCMRTWAATSEGKASRRRTDTSLSGGLEPQIILRLLDNLSAITSTESPGSNLALRHSSQASHFDFPKTLRSSFVILSRSLASDAVICFHVENADPSNKRGVIFANSFLRSLSSPISVTIEWAISNLSIHLSKSSPGSPLNLLTTSRTFFIGIAVISFLRNPKGEIVFGQSLLQIFHSNSNTEFFIHRDIKSFNHNGESFH